MVSAEGSSHARKRGRKNELLELDIVQGNSPQWNFRKRKRQPYKEVLLECRRSACVLFDRSFAMDKNTKIWIVGVILFVFLTILLLGLYVGPYFAKQPTFCVTLNGENTCHSTDSKPYRFYGTKTPYRVAVPSHHHEDNFHFGNCTPTLFYLLSRHATRYPDGEQIEEMQITLPALKEKLLKAFEEGTSKICRMDIVQLKNWYLNMVPEDDNRLSDTGKKEAVDLAQRYKARFPSLLDRGYSPELFEFEYTSKERTHTTAQSFAEGLFGKLRSRYVQGKINDEVLQFHKNCKGLLKKCNSTSGNLEEIEKFQKGIFMKSLLSSVSKRVGFNVSHDDIEVMHRACMFGYALGLSDIWCSVFSRDDLRVMEYDDDIDDYYKDGYGNKLNYEQACPVIKYLVDLFKSAGRTESKAVLQFSHAGGIKKVYSRLGLFKDETPLTSENLCYQQNRKWRSSLMLPFNSNIAFVMLNCGGGEKIAAFHNEEPVVVEGCQNFLCPIEEFYSAYGNIASSCDINRLCCSCCLY